MSALDYILRSQNPIPSPEQPQNGFDQYVDSYNKAATSLQAIQNARQQHEQQKEAWELEKKQKALDLEKSQLGNNLTETQIGMMKSLMNQHNSQTDDVLAAKETLLDHAEQQHTQAANQAKQGVTASLAAIVGGQQQAPTSYEDRINAMRQAGVDPDAMLKGSGLYVPPKPKNTVGDFSEQLSNLSSKMPQLDENATDEEKMAWLQQLPAGTAAVVKNIADYKLPLQQVASLRGNQRLALAQLVSLYNPDIDMNKYGQRQKWLGSMASGDGNKQLLRINTAMGHIATLKNAFDELHNGNFTPWNKGANAVKAGFGDPAPKKVQLAGNAVADELETIFRMQGGSIEGIKAWRKSFDDASSPAQQVGVLNEALELLSSRVDALKQQHKNIMGKDDLQVLFPKSIEAMKSLEGQTVGAKPEATQNGGRVRVKKGSQVFTVPSEQLEDALAQGYERA